MTLTIGLDDIRNIGGGDPYPSIGVGAKKEVRHIGGRWRRAIVTRVLVWEPLEAFRAEVVLC